MNRLKKITSKKGHELCSSFVFVSYMPYIIWASKYMKVSSSHSITLLNYGYNTKWQVVCRSISWLNKGNIIYVTKPCFVVLLNSFNMLSCLISCKEVEELHFPDSHRVFFLTASPPPKKNVLSTGSHAKLPVISLSFRDLKGMLYLEYLGRTSLKKTVYSSLL